MCQTCAISVRYLTNLLLSNVYLPILTTEVKEQVDVSCRPAWEKPVPSDAPTPAGANPSQAEILNFILDQELGRPWHRGPNGLVPYQSPTIPHLPKNPATNHAPTTQHPQPSMGPFGPSPHFPQMAVQSGMLPLGSNLGAVPSASFSRPPSRSGMMQRGPSFVPRQPPVNPQEAGLNAELSRLPRTIVNSLKQELNVGDKDLYSLSFEDKVTSPLMFELAFLLMRSKTLILYQANLRLSAPLTQAGRKPRKPYGPAGAFNRSRYATTRSASPDQRMPPQMGMKRNISPLEEVYFNDPHYIPLGSRIFQGFLLNNESSPPDNKRVRRSSASMDQVSIPQYPHPWQSQPQPGAVGPQSMPNGAMVRQGLMVPEPTNSLLYGPSGMARKLGMTLPPRALSMGGAMPPGITPADRMIMHVSEAFLKFSPC